MSYKQENSSFRIHRRRRSLFADPQSSSIIAQRQQIRQKYYSFVQWRKKSLQQSPHQKNVQTKVDSMSYGQMPSIRIVQSQSQMLQQSLRKTVNRYFYYQNQKQRQLQILNRKKKKYEKVLKIREQHHEHKRKLSQSLTVSREENEKQIYRLKTSVDNSKFSAQHSRIKLHNIKKTMGQQRRFQILQNKYKIKSNQNASYENCKQLHSSILIQKQQVIKKKLQHFQQKKRLGKQGLVEKLQKQIRQLDKFEKKQQISKSIFSKKIEQLMRSRKIIDSKLKAYENFLKDGSTLRKPKIINFKDVNKIQIQKSNESSHHNLIYSDQQEAL